MAASAQQVEAAMAAGGAALQVRDAAALQAGWRVGGWSGRGRGRVHGWGGVGWGEVGGRGMWRGRGVVHGARKRALFGRALWSGSQPVLFAALPPRGTLAQPPPALPSAGLLSHPSATSPLPPLFHCCTCCPPPDACATAWGGRGPGLQKSGSAVVATARELHGLLTAQQHLSGAVGATHTVRRLLQRCLQVGPPLLPPRRPAHAYAHVHTATCIRTRHAGAARAPRLH